MVAAEMVVGTVVGTVVGMVVGTVAVETIAVVCQTLFLPFFHI
jgi:hypothetical protein